MINEFNPDQTFQVGDMVLRVIADNSISQQNDKKHWT